MSITLVAHTGFSPACLSTSTFVQNRRIIGSSPWHYVRPYPPMSIPIAVSFAVVRRRRAARTRVVTAQSRNALKTVVKPDDEGTSGGERASRETAKAEFNGRRAREEGRPRQESNLRHAV
jgi:hypothetical protein